MLSNGNRIVAILGPTCTGKSALSLDVAMEFGGEIINADSMQVYRHFDIGTAKPDAPSLGKCPHHLIDIVEPLEEFNAAIFKEKADAAIQDIWSRGKIPVLVGGTGLYLRALLYGLFQAPSDKALREELQKAYDNDPLRFYESLKEVDHAYAMRISFKDRMRAVRATEVFRLTGTPMSDLERTQGFGEERYAVLRIGLKRERDELYGRINERVDKMLASGWVDEVRKILALGYPEDSKPFSGIGYREILLHIHGVLPYEEMAGEIKKQTRHYAKRQLTWFSRERGVSWFRYPEEKETIRDKAAEFLRSWN